MAASGQSRIAFVRHVPGEGDQILTMDQDAHDVTQLTGGAGQGENSCPAWSPDGTQLCFASWRDGRTRLFVMQADGSHQPPLTPADEADEDFPAWSPDGAFLAFSRTYGPRPGLYVMPATGGDPRYLTPGNYPDWSPLADCIAYSYNGCIWTIGVDRCGQRRSAPVAVRQDPEVIDGHPSWSPCARSLAFDREVFRDGQYGRHIMTMTVEGGSLRDLGRGRLPAWSSGRGEA